MYAILQAIKTSPIFWKFKPLHFIAFWNRLKLQVNPQTYTQYSHEYVDLIFVVIWFGLIMMPVPRLQCLSLESHHLICNIYSMLSTILHSHRSLQVRVFCFPHDWVAVNIWNHYKGFGAIIGHCFKKVAGVNSVSRYWRKPSLLLLPVFETVIKRYHCVCYQ